MKEDKVLEILRHYRHDWLNDLQLIMGYAQLGKLEKVQDKINQVLERTEMERQLDRLAIPQTMLWLMTYNWKSESVDLTYELRLDKRPDKLSDEVLSSHIQEVFSILEQYQQKFQHYHGTLKMQLHKKHSVHIQLIFEEIWENEEELIEQLLHLPFIQSVHRPEHKPLQIKWLE
ncbi:Spo0B domain-containing protein [Gracilibacillus sp. YIM 98692]|uniref:Spo0B domain-containing protein n=1 Tax=Gracilibacillus sp. YIM 98692 TaxID=2663532 RepID=UPI0013D1FD6D|nr:Spo0B domain-containing protein [Gracilibacillus sp. YIM 98692]